MQYREGLKKRLHLILITGVMFALPSVCLAQADIGCSDTDPTDPCPLDNWVIVLAVIVVAFAAVHLSHKQKSKLA